MKYFLKELKIKLIFTLVFVIFSFNLYSQNVEIKAEQSGKELLHYFLNNDFSGLKSWFENWEKQPDSYCKKTEKSDIQVESEVIYQTVCIPKLISKSKYFVIPAYLFVKQGSKNTLNYKSIEDSVNHSTYYSNSKIHLSLNKKFFDKPVLYLNTEYFYSLNLFFNEQNMKSSIIEKGPIDEKRKFLSPYLSTHLMHDFIAFHYETFPVIQFIYFNKSLTSAIVFIQDSYCNGRHLLMKKNNKNWETTETLSNWMI